MTKDRRLGRGLAALLGSPLNETVEDFSTTTDVPQTSEPLARDPLVRVATPGDAGATAKAVKAGDLLHLNVHEIEDNPFQPRRDFSEPEIASLAESLKEHDMLQPILVRRLGDRYQLISGERRLRAAILAGWTTVPAQFREADDRLVAELAIVENLQRKDLNPVEKALSFKRYVDEHHCTQEDLAQRLKIDRSTIANLMRLLELPTTVLDAIRTNLITAGHARALLPLGDPRSQVAFCEKICREELSVRDVERQVTETIESEDATEPVIAGRIGSPPIRPRSEQLASLEQELRVALGTKVEIRLASKGRGKLIVHFGDHEEFERLREQLTESPQPTDGPRAASR